MKDGKVVGPNDMSFWVHDFYVHPETHILYKGEGDRYLRYRRPEIKPKVAEIDGQEYYCHEGVWYRVRFQAVDDAGPAPHDVFNKISTWAWGGTTRWTLKEAYGLDKNRKARYCIWKQQANSKEIRKIKKANEND